MSTRSSGSSAARRSPGSPTGSWATSTSSGPSSAPPRSRPRTTGPGSGSRPKHLAYLKVSEGCDRLCTFCAIPYMRGKHVTKPIEKVVEEARELAADGVRELNLVAQDMTYYGVDLYGRPRLGELLRELERGRGDRLDSGPVQLPEPLHRRPLRRPGDLLEGAALPRHAAPAHQRPDAQGDEPAAHSREQTEAIIARLRSGDRPGLVLRTTFIVGFPGETEAEFEELLAYVESARFERLGVFPYSLEPDTPAARLPGHLLRRGQIRASRPDHGDPAADRLRAQSGPGRQVARRPDRRPRPRLASRRPGLAGAELMPTPRMSTAWSTWRVARSRPGDLVRCSILGERRLRPRRPARGGGLVPGSQASAQAEEEAGLALHHPQLILRTIGRQALGMPHSDARRDGHHVPGSVQAGVRGILERPERADAQPDWGWPWSSSPSWPTIWYWWALAVFVVAALTDALDGYFARLLDQGTAIGRQLDPLVDKVIVCGAFIYLLSVPADTGLAPWMVTTIVVRELLIQGLRSHLEGGGQAFGAKTAGKLKTLAQCLSISAILVLGSGLSAVAPGLAPGPRRPHLVGRTLDGLQRARLFRPGPPQAPGPLLVLAPLIPNRRDLMDWIESLALGLVQGLTEFLPISSDGHLNITQRGFNALTGKPDQVGRGRDLLRSSCSTSGRSWPSSSTTGIR